MVGLTSERSKDDTAGVRPARQERRESHPRAGGCSEHRAEAVSQDQQKHCIDKREWDKAEYSS